MSDPTNKKAFVAILNRLLERHKLNYDEIALETGISSQILKNAANGRSFTANTPRLNALRAYLDKIENGATPKDLNRTEEEYRALEDRVRALEDKMNEFINNKETNGV